MYLRKVFLLLMPCQEYQLREYCRSRLIEYSTVVSGPVVVKVFDILRQPVEFCYGIVLLLWTSLSKLLIAVR